MKYYYDDQFETYLPERWELLLHLVLPKANYVELCRSFTQEDLAVELAAAEVELPSTIQRLYCATNRFYLTPDVAAFLSKRAYSDLDSVSAFEDLAFYHNNILLLGTISHEDCVVMLLSEGERQELNERGFGFQSEWKF